MNLIFIATDFPPLVILLCVLAIGGAALASCLGESSDHSDHDDHGH